MTLEAEGFLVRTYTDGESALQALTAKPVDLAVLDIKMPRMDGMELLQRLRARSALPVIFLTSKDEEVDELMGLRLGADDYITKPFSQRLLIERIRALLRRNETSRAEGSGAALGGIMVRGELTLDETKHQCIWHGNDIQLTVTEFLLVKALAADLAWSNRATSSSTPPMATTSTSMTARSTVTSSGCARSFARPTTTSTISRRSTASAIDTRTTEPRHAG